MSSLVEAASDIIRSSQDRLLFISMNIENVSTSGYKRRIPAQRIDDSSADFARLLVEGGSDLSAGKPQVTGAALDIAIQSEGFFQLRKGDEVLFSRQGSFSLSSDGRVMNAQGYTLQQAGGGDVVLDGQDVRIAGDGTVFDGDRPVARIGVFLPANANGLSAVGGSNFRFDAPEQVEDVSLLQGAVEASNVAFGDEMVGMMSALRQAESGAHLMQTYDELLGKAATAFGQVGR